MSINVTGEGSANNIKHKLSLPGIAYSVGSKPNNLSFWLTDDALPLSIVSFAELFRVIANPSKGPSSLLLQDFVPYAMGILPSSYVTCSDVNRVEKDSWVLNESFVSGKSLYYISPESPKNLLSPKNLALEILPCFMCIVMHVHIASVEIVLQKLDTEGKSVGTPSEISVTTDEEDPWTFFRAYLFNPILPLRFNN